MKSSKFLIKNLHCKILNTVYRLASGLLINTSRHCCNRRYLSAVFQHFMYRCELQIAKACLRLLITATCKPSQPTLFSLKLFYLNQLITQLRRQLKVKFCCRRMHLFLNLCNKFVNLLLTHRLNILSYILAACLNFL